MKIQPKFSLLIIVSLVLFSCDFANKESKDYKPVIANNDNNIALNNPDKLAWEQFIELNKPVDPDKPDGSVIWENWALAYNVFGNPHKAPSWEEAIKTPDSLINQPKGLIQQKIVDDLLVDGDLTMQFDPTEPSERMGGLNETRFNKVVYDFIVDSSLYYQEGIEKFMKNKIILDLPTEAKEVKAVWDTISKKDIGKFHYAIQETTEGKIYWGLVALHIISKEIPQWTWATFEHTDNPRLKEAENDPILKSIDKFGRKNGVISDELEKLFMENNMSQKWRNYILRGTQTNFVDFKGNPTILANTFTENRFLYTSSCITCHSMATLGSSLTFEELPKAVQDTIKYGKIKKNIEEAKNHFNRLSFVEKVLPEPDPNTNESILMYIGSPNPKWFDTTYVSGRKDTYKQLDFMWSFFRAKRRNPYKAE